MRKEVRGSMASNYRGEHIVLPTIPKEQWSDFRVDYEAGICKQFVSNAKNRKNLKPCRGFKSFRSLAFRIQFLKNRIFGGSNPST